MSQLETVSPANTETSQDRNPYVGPRTFTRKDGDRFYGRERESRDLLALVTAERLVLFYAQSGAGKSSLINARLIPGVEAEGFEVLPVGRVSGRMSLRPANGADGTQAQPNVFAYYLMLSLDQSHEDPNRFAHLSLSDFLINLNSDGERYLYRVPSAETKELAGAAPASGNVEIWPRVLIIDQFEEILTSNLHAWQQRGDFFSQLQQAMADDPYLYVVLVMREDYVAGLDRYAHLLPGRLHTRYYMERMRYPAALEAVKMPVAQRRPFVPGVAENLVDNLRQLRMAGPEMEKIEYAISEFVEPVQLQVVCYQLWEHLQNDPGDEISAADLRKLAGEGDLAGFVNRALSDFYEQAIAKVLAAPDLHVSERALRTWFSTQLITETGTRGFVHQGETETAGLPNEAVRLLQDQFLVRAESRAGAVWYELIHDRFVEPILTANRQWQRAHRNPLLADAEAWLASDRAPQRLYEGKQLHEARAAIDANPDEFSPLEKEFVEVSVAADEQRKARRQRVLFTGAILLVFVLAALTVWGFYNAINARQAEQEALDQKATAEVAATEAITAQKLAVVEAGKARVAQQDAEAQARLSRQALSGQLAAQAQITIEDPALALLLSIEALNVTQSVGEPRVPAAEQSLRDALNAVSARVAQSNTKEIRSIGIGAADRQIVSIDDTSVYLWQMDQGALSDQPDVIDIDGEFITAVTISADNRWSITSSSPMVEDLRGGSGTTLRLWDLQADVLQPVMLGNTAESVKTAAISPDSRLAVTGGGDGSLRLWDLTGQAPRLMGHHEAAITAIAFSPDSLQVATGSSNGVVRLWDLATLAPEMDFVELRGHEGAISALAISPDSRWLATASQDRTARLYPLPLFAARSTQSLVLLGHEGPINAVSVSADSHWLVTGAADGTARLWDLAASNPSAAPLVLRGHTEAITSLALGPDGQWLVTGSADSTARIWNLVTDPENDSIVLHGHEGTINTVAISLDGHWLLTGDTKGVIRMWALRLDDLVIDGCRAANRNLTALEWAQYFPERAYHRTCPDLPTHPSVIQAYVADGQALAKRGDTEEAAQRFRTALDLDPTLALDPAAEIVKNLLAEGRTLAREGDALSATARFQKALSVDPNLDIDPMAAVDDIVLAQELVKTGQESARQGDFANAVVQFQRALELDPMLNFDPQGEARRLAPQAGAEFGAEYLFGFHDPGGEYLMLAANRPGWILFSEAIGHDPNDRSGKDYSTYSEQGLGVIVRLNNGYSPDGTLPNSSQYEDFGQRCANFVAASGGAHIWVIGNEMNFWAERPGVTSGPDSGEVITPERYARAYTLCRDAIHVLAGHEDDQVLVGAVAPWNNNTTYPGNPNGDWVQYLHDILARLGPTGSDGVAINTYTHGSDPGLILDDTRLDPPFQNRYYQFRTYRDFMGAVPEDMRHLAVYITASDQDVAWEDTNNGWIQLAYAEINWWNSQPDSQKIRALILYRWPKYDRWYIEGKTGVIADFQDALKNDYRWTQRPTHPLIPLSASPGSTVYSVVPTNLRRAPGFTDTAADDILAELPINQEVTLMDGPRTVDGLIWWRIRTLDDGTLVEGWVPQAGYRSRVRLSLLPIESPEPVGPTDEFAVGEAVCNVSFDAIELRSSAGQTEQAPVIVGVVPSRATLVIKAGPQPAQDQIWWQVQADTQAGAIEGWVPVATPGGERLLVPAATCQQFELSWPFAGHYPITQSFGENSDFYNQFTYDGVPLRGHNGLDFATPLGTPILAVDDGRVTTVGAAPAGFGNWLTIEHSWGESTYTQMQRIHVQEGQLVMRGEPLGLSGNSGASSGPHLGFYIRIFPYDRGDGWGGYSDPIPFLP